MSIKTNKKLLLPLLTIVALGINQASLAHTSALLEAVGGVALDNAIAIGHGCELQNRPIIAQSVVFPTVNPIITSTGTTPITNLSDVLEGSLENIADLISSKDIFSVQGEKTNALGNVVGFFGRQGSLPTFAQGRVPFLMIAPRFNDNSCAQKVTVEYAIADICVTSKPTLRPEKVNLWIPNNGSTFAVRGLASGVEGIGEPAVLIINRDTVNNPLPSTCASPIDVTVTISPQDIDANLPITGWTF